MAQVQKIGVAAVTGVIAVFLSGCGGSTSCTMTMQSPNPFTGEEETITASVDGASSDCCDAMQATARGETPSNPQACEGASLTESDSYGGADCSGKSYPGNGGFKTFYGLPDDCGTELGLEPTSVPASCQQADSFCVRTTINFGDPHAVCYALCAQTMGCNCDCFCGTCDAVCGNGCYDSCDPLYGCKSRCSFGEDELVTGSVISSVLHDRFALPNQSSPKRWGNVSQPATAKVEVFVNTI